MSYKTAREVLCHIDNYMYLTKMLYVVSYKISHNIPYISYIKGNVLFHDIKLFPAVPGMTVSSPIAGAHIFFHMNIFDHKIRYYSYRLDYCII